MPERASSHWSDLVRAAPTELDWLRTANSPGDALGSWVGVGHESYTLVPHYPEIFGSAYENGKIDPITSHALVELVRLWELATSGPVGEGRYVAALFEWGFPDLPPILEERSAAIGMRSYQLFECELASLYELERASGWSPSIFWPQTREWCIAGDPDLPGSIVAGPLSLGRLARHLRGSSATSAETTIAEAIQVLAVSL